MTEKTVLERLLAINAENQSLVSVSIGTLKAARSEIQAHVKLNGNGIMTDMVMDQLNKAIGDGEQKNDQINHNQRAYEFYRKINTRITCCWESS